MLVEAGYEHLLFLSPTGARLTHTATDLQQLSKAVTKNEIQVTPTLMRKLVATSVVSQQSELATNAVANHMSHGVDTSKKHYQNVQGDRNSIRAFNIIKGPRTPTPSLFTQRRRRMGHLQ